MVASARVCGIAGCVEAPGRAPDRAALARMADALAHRGPDGAGVEVHGNVGLVHRRLAIVDPSEAGRQPMALPDGWRLTYNGEVFNHLDLRRALPGVAWRGGCDTETLLHALATWGEGALDRLNGLFAFAAIDPHRRRLLLVRDRLGVKPLYLARHDGALWFASEMRALLAAGVPVRTDPDVLRFSVLGWPNGETTPLAGIERLPAGMLLSVDLETLEVERRRWWRPADAVDPELAAALATRSRGELAGGVEAALRTSVSRRLMADVPVATLCSGGVDSSLITVFAAEEQPGALALNASVVEQPELDEGPWARAVAHHAGAELHTVEVTGASFRSGFVGTVEHHEYPLQHPGSVPMVQLAALARDLGAKVLLSGEGADELLGGYDWQHAGALDAFRARRAPLRLLRALAGEARATRRAGDRDAPAAVEVCERAARDDAQRAYAHHRGTRRRLEGALAADLELYLSHLLNRQDKCTMAASIETREPFLDPDVVRLALNLPLEARVDPDRKALLRDLARRLLPEGVADRPKVGFHFATRALIEERADPAFLEDGRLRELLGTPRGEWCEGLRLMPEAWGFRVWSAEVWCRLFLGGDSRAAVEAALWRDDPAAAAA